MNDVKLLIGGKSYRLGRRPRSSAAIPSPAQSSRAAPPLRKRTRSPQWTLRQPHSLAGRRPARVRGAPSSNKAAPAAVFTRDLARGRSKAIASRQWTRAHNVIMP